MIMKKLYTYTTALLIGGAFGLGDLRAQTCIGAYPAAGEVALAAGAWLPAVPPATPWGNNAPPTAAGAGNVNCGYSGILTVPACANNYATIFMCVGNSYTVSLCSGASWNSSLSLTNTAGAVVAPATFDNDGCGTPGGLSTFSFIPTIAANYRIRIRTNPCTIAAGSCGTMQISINPVPPPPANDSPCGAISLNPVTATCTPFATTASFATQSNPPIAPLCGAFSGIDVWYTATVPPSGNLSIQVDHVSATNLAMAAYTAAACGGPFTLLSCNADLANPTLLNPFLIYSALAPGATVYIRVWPEGNYTTNGAFEICAYEPIPPVNDNPCGSILLSVGSPCAPTAFTTESATPLAATMITAPALPTCGIPLTGGDVWFRFVAPATGSVTISALPGSLTNMAMAVYFLTAGTICGPGTLTQLLCDDNSGVGGTMPRIVQGGLTPTNTYYIRMWNQSTSFGTASICVIPNTPPANDNPCNALAISATSLNVNAGCLFSGFTTEYATITPVNGGGLGWINAPAPGCGGAANSDVWFTAVVPANGVLQFDTDDGSLSNVAMAVYTATGTCGGNNLTLTQAGCATAGSPNGPNMPYLSVAALPAGQTVYVRLWRETVLVDGTFQLCARTTASPTGGCDYVLRMTDSGGDGWNGSTVQVCIDPPGAPPPVCTNYTIVGALGNITISADVGSLITFNYSAVGGFQNQIAYQVTTPVGGVLYSSPSPPTTGIAYGFTVDALCNVPAAPISDCVGALQVCNTQIISGSPVPGFGSTQDLSAGNRGCLAGNEIRGVWVSFTASISGTIAFTIAVAGGTDYDFAVWGPFSGPPTCPPPGPPLRCSWSGATGNTGLNYTSVDLTEGAGGDKWVRWIDALAGQSFMLYVDNWSNNGVAFTLSWQVAPTNMLDCTLPVELLSLAAEAKPRQVDLRWSTGSEQNSAYFQVERAADGAHFEPLGRVQAAGSSQSIREYTYVDAAPLKGVNYYRLQQVDMDGKLDYSNTVSATYTWSNVALNVYPNPAGESLWAAFEMPTEGAVRWRIMDMSGRLVAGGPAVVASGMNQVEIPLARVEVGSYMLELIDGAGVSLSNARFVKQ